MATRISRSQPNPKRKSQVEPQHKSLSQRVRRSTQNITYAEEDSTPVELHEATNKMVKLCLLHLDNTKILRRPEIQKHIVAKGKGITLNKIIDAANEQLKAIYGYELVLVDDVKVKTPGYVFKKKTPHLKLPNPEPTNDGDKVLTILILATVFMSGEQCTEETVQKLLEQLEYQKDNMSQDLDDHLKEMCKSRLIDMQNGEISLGPLADIVVNKMAILDFMSDLYNTDVRSWKEIHTKALQQIKIDNIEDSNPDNHMEEE